MILRLLAESPHLHYYQGLHDVVLTFLLVTSEDVAYAIMSALVRCHIRYHSPHPHNYINQDFSLTSRDYLDTDMTRTKIVISCLSPLLALEDTELESFVTR